MKNARATSIRSSDFSRFCAFCAISLLAWRVLSEKQEESLIESGEISVNTQSLYYGVNGGDAEILAIINEVANNHSMGANVTLLKKALFEIVATESDFGYAVDKTLNSGEGLTQFDKTTYNELRDELLKQGKNPYNLESTPYNALRTNPKLQIYMARYFLYRRVPSAIGATLSARASQWKKYYNTIYGAGTTAHYESMANKHYKRLGVNYGS